MWRNFSTLKKQCGITEAANILRPSRYSRIHSVLAHFSLVSTTGTKIYIMLTKYGLVWVTMDKVWIWVQGCGIQRIIGLNFTSNGAGGR